ncbi:estradiol 17-beta-dehydrogenase [Microdochium trichocladiopsis]|uniref:Short-chain dehydrogenase/reductase 3 n=1 Tax=Microdochium trichocladiopsis TaxID=1682393 RepID=A0A9P8YCD3_9PEZI|nr:estradiol 17-beta-dehydrogenase [Microdochium trichocladiopsis]KAH7035315.1 estradiol 17-beta-dehydrogenase [Microdochium trichocladiopsis]
MPTHKRWLPREGFYADVLFQLIGRTAFNPALLVPLFLLTRLTERGKALALLHPLAASRLGTLTWIAVARLANAWLSDRVINNGLSDRYDWPREIAVVTGGAGGIGGHLVRLLEEKGMKVIVLDILPMTYKTGPNVHYYQVDLTKSAKVAAVATRVREEIGSPTILINNAGVLRGKAILDTSDEDLRFTFEVNTFAHYYTVREFLPAMVRADHGMVVTVASAASYFGAPQVVDYSSTKAAALAFHEGLAAELKTHYRAPRVRTVIVHPGAVDTALFGGHTNQTPFMTPTLHPETVAEAIYDQVITGRSGQVLLPKFVNVLPWFRALPSWLQYSERAKSNELMAKFTGREVVADLKKYYKES